MCIHMDQKEKVRDVVLMLQCSKKRTTAKHALRFVVALATYIPVSTETEPHDGSHVYIIFDAMREDFVAARR